MLRGCEFKFSNKRGVGDMVCSIKLQLLSPGTTTATKTSNTIVKQYLIEPEEDVSVLKHAILEGDNNELRVFEMSSQHLPDILSVRQVQSRVYLGNNYSSTQGES